MDFEYYLEQGSERIGYHIAPTKLDNIIEQKGIGKNNIAYIWLKEDNADWFKEYHENPSIQQYPIKMTKWIIDITNLKLKRDPESEDMSQWSSRFKEGEFGEAYIYLME